MSWYEEYPVYALINSFNFDHNKMQKQNTEIKDHVDVGEGINGIDFAAGSKIAGARLLSYLICHMIVRHVMG